MKMDFPLFSSPLDLSFSYWTKLLRPGDTVIDATCGNGKDTLRLALHLLRLSLNGKVIGMDIQAQAIAATQQRLQSHLSSAELARIELYHQSHAEFPFADPETVRLIVYNLGYLPGSDKTVKTLSSSTLQSVSAALTLLQQGGMLSLTCYPGHSEGKEEQFQLLEWASTLPPQNWNVCHHQWLNTRNSPTLLLIQKNTT